MCNCSQWLKLRDKKVTFNLNYWIKKVLKGKESREVKNFMRGMRVIVPDLNPYSYH